MNKTKPNQTDSATLIMNPIGTAKRFNHGSESNRLPIESDCVKTIQYGEAAFDVITPPIYGLPETDALCAKIARAVNLLAAHEAVAEAAQDIPEGQSTDKLEKALAQLAKLKEEAK